VADIYPQQHDKVSFFAGSDRRLIFTVDEVTDLNSLLAAEWTLIPGISDSRGNRVQMGDGTPSITKSLGFGITVLDAGNAVIAVDLDPLDTAPAGQAQITGRFFDQLKLRLASGKQDTVSFGNYVVLPSDHEVL
jgi:hypothetical protein